MSTVSLQMLLSRGTRLVSSLVPSCTVVVQAEGVHHHLERRDLKRFLGIERSNRARANRNTHVNEKMFRRMRGRKTVTIDLPDDVEQRRLDAMPPYQMRNEMLKKGINPYREIAPRSWQEAQITLQSFYGVMDPYVTNERPISWVNNGAVVEGLKSKADEVKDSVQHRFHNWKNGVNRIRKKEGFEKFSTKVSKGMGGHNAFMDCAARILAEYVEETVDGQGRVTKGWMASKVEWLMAFREAFHYAYTKEFGATADLIYEEAHNALMTRDTKKLHDFITEHAYNKMWPDVAEGSIVWKMVEKIEPSKVVAVRCADHPYKSGNDIAQITLRMHHRQILAVYDRFGQLILGSETEPRDSVEYVVFENHIAVIDGKWRLHDKVYPRWAEKKEGVIPTRALGSGEVRPDFASSLPLRAQELTDGKLTKKEEDD